MQTTRLLLLVVFSKKGISVPYPLPTPTEDTNWKVSFEKPEDITIVGSWTTKLAVKAQDKRPYRVDLALEMPSVRYIVH